MMRVGPALLLLIALTACTEPSVSSTDRSDGPSRTTSDSITGGPAYEPTPTPLAADGSIYFAAESSAGEALTDFRSFGEVETDPKQMDIYLSRRGQPVRRIIATRAHERCPVVSPDGSRLAYLAGPTVVVVTLDLDGIPGAAEARVDLRSRGLYRPDDHLPRNGAGPACPQWSPDGRRLGYLAMTGEPNTPLSTSIGAEMLAVTLDGKVRVLTTVDTAVWDSPHFAWSPDGDAFAYTTTDGVWRTRADGGDAELVWPSPGGDATQMMPMDFDRPISLAWSSRNELAFTVRSFEPTDPNNPNSGGRERWRVLVVDAGSGRTLLEAAAGSEFEAGAGESWPPDGSRLVFTGPRGRILLHDRATGTTHRVRTTVGGGDGATVEGAMWSPDGQRLLARARDDAKGFALVSFGPNESSTEVRTPWTWSLDWTSLDDVAWSSR
jgi:Tol biopolymer transport system component